MEDANINRNRLREAIREYEQRFEEDAPEFLMMESTEEYIDELETAVQKNKPIRKDGKGRPTFDIVY